MFPLYIDLTPIVCISVWEGLQTFLFPILGNHSKEAARQKTLKDGSAREVFGGLVPSRAEPFHSPILIGRLSEEYSVTLLR